MITKQSDYEQTAAYGQGIKTLEKGGYVCQILKAEEVTDKNGNPMIHIAFDIGEGENKFYFRNLFNSRKEKNDKEFKETKWPFEGQMWIHTTDYEDRNKTSRQFKGFCTALEDSGVKVWNENAFLIENLKGASVGVVFRNEENEYNDKSYWRAIPWGFRSIDVIRTGDFFVPDDVSLKQKPSDSAPIPQSGYTQLSETDVPF